MGGFLWFVAQALIGGVFLLLVVFPSLLIFWTLVDAVWRALTRQDPIERW